MVFRATALFWVNNNVLVKYSIHKERMMTKTANDQRSTVKNPNNDQFKQAQDNRANQLNPNHRPTKSNRG